MHATPALGRVFPLATDRIASKSYPANAIPLPARGNQFRVHEQPPHTCVKYPSPPPGRVHSIMHAFSSPGTAAEATNNFRRSQFRRLQRAESTQSGPVREMEQGAATREPAATRGSALCDPMICACGSALRRAYRPDRRRGRVAEGGGLLNRYRLVKAYRGFESLRLRQTTCVRPGHETNGLAGYPGFHTRPGPGSAGFGEGSNAHPLRCSQWHWLRCRHLPRCRVMLMTKATGTPIKSPRQP